METGKGLHLLQQDVFEKELGLPRWGCFFMTFLGALQFYFNRAFTQHEIIQIYWKAREVLSWDKKPVLEMRTGPIPQGKEYELFVNNPTMLLQIGCSFIAPTFLAAQIPDLHCYHPDMKPATFDCQYVAKEIRRPLGVHWVLAEPHPAYSTLYNPLVSCTGIWTGYWRGIKIWQR